WQVCTTVGVVAGSLLEDANLGLDFAMSVTFIGIVVPLLRTRPLLLSAVVSGVAGLVLNDMPNKLGLLIAALLGIAAGYLAETMSQPVGEIETRETKVRE